MTENKWWKNFKEDNTVNTKFTDEMDIEIKYGRDLYDNKYRKQHDMCDLDKRKLKHREDYAEYLESMIE